MRLAGFSVAAARRAASCSGIDREAIRGCGVQSKEYPGGAPQEAESIAHRKARCGEA
jgi:hypothetical protein